MVEHVDAVAFLPRGARPSRKLAGEHDFVTPSLPTPTIARPAVWTASQRSIEEVLAVVEELEAGASSRKELLRRVRGVEVMLHWLQRFEGESWQQRWLASGADTAGKTWPDLVEVEEEQTDPKKIRAQATGAAGRLILADAIRPSYDWLYGSPSSTLYARFEQLRDPDGFATIGARCEADRRMASTDRRAALIQLCRILMHNGGLLDQISLADCVEAYRVLISTAFTLVHPAARRRHSVPGLSADNPCRQPPRAAHRRRDRRWLQHRLHPGAGPVRGLLA